MFGLSLVLLTTTTGCRRVTLSLEQVPGNTPRGAKIYVAGSFNNWNPGDPAYEMRYDEQAKQYRVDLPLGFGSLEYKFTRGDWTTAETDPCGGSLQNHKLVYGKEKIVAGNIQGWADLEPENCGRITLILQKVPLNTPQNDSIYLGGDINGWQSNSPDYRFDRQKNGQYVLTIPRRTDKVTFKLTRGTWETAELNKAGDEQLQREISFGKQDTLYLSVNAWADKPLQRVRIYTVVLESMPANTPANSEIYLVGNFNNWNPIDHNYRFTSLSNGKKSITVKYSGIDPFAYKVTRGGWQRVENDRLYNDINNRTIGSTDPDTVYIKIAAWAENAPPRVKEHKYPVPVPPAAPSVTAPPEISAATAPSVPSFTSAPPAIPNPKKVPGIRVSPPAPVNPPVIDYARCKKVFIIIDTLPAMEPGERIFLTGDFNDWNGGDPGFMFSRLPDGKRYFLLRLMDDRAHEFKVTRGSWNSEEVAYNKEKIKNRLISRGHDNDTIHIKVANWKDNPLTPKTGHGANGNTGKHRAR